MLTQEGDFTSGDVTLPSALGSLFLWLVGDTVGLLCFLGSHLSAQPSPILQEDGVVRRSELPELAVTQEGYGPISSSLSIGSLE